MSLKDINNNQELVNAYKSFKSMHEQYLALPDKQKIELNNLKESLLISINHLESNENFREVASDEEKNEIQSIKDGLGAS
jgi:hypothetical protein